MALSLRGMTTEFSASSDIVVGLGEGSGAIDEEEES